MPEKRREEGREPDRQEQPQFEDEFPTLSGKAGPPAERKPPRPRRASPLGLMGAPGWEAPKASGWPSLRAVGIMAAVVVVVLILVFIFVRN